MHNKSIINTGGAIYYFDGINKRFSMIGGDGVQGLSDISDMSQYFKNIEYNGADETNNLYTSTPKGAVAGYNPNLRKVYLSIYTGTSTPDTISFNEYIRAFESEHTWGSTVYHTHKNDLLTLTGGNLYVQDKGLPLNFFGTDHTSSLTFIVTGIPDMKKVLTNLEFGAYLRNSTGGVFNNNDAFIPITEIRTSNSYQLAVTENTNNLKKRFKTWRYQVPRENGGSLRMMDYFFYVTITNDNEFHDTETPTALYIDDITAHYLIPLI